MKRVTSKKELLRREAIQEATKEYYGRNTIEGLEVYLAIVGGTEWKLKKELQSAARQIKINLKSV